MRAATRAAAAQASRLLFVEKRALLEVGHLFVADVRCVSSIRCKLLSHGFRRSDEWTDWTAKPCPKCGGKKLRLLREVYAEVEVNGAAKIVRWREVGPETLEPVDGAIWRYAPFEMAGNVEKLLRK